MSDDECHCVYCWDFSDYGDSYSDSSVSFTNLHEDMASAVTVNQPGAVNATVVLPESIKDIGAKNGLFQENVNKLQYGRMSAEEFRSFMLSKFLKDDIVRILKANSVKHSSADLKGNLCLKLIQFIKLNPTASLSPKSTTTMNIAGPSTSQASSSSLPSQQPTPKPKVLATCNALFLLPGNNDSFLSGGWEVFNMQCKCQTLLSDLLFAMTDKLPVVSQTLLRDAVLLNVPEIVDMLNTFGELDVASGCKNRLLMQMRDLFLEQATQQAVPGMQTGTQTPPVALKPIIPLIDLSSGPSEAVALPPASKKPKVEIGLTSTPLPKPLDLAKSANQESTHQQTSKKATEVLKSMHVTFGQNMMNVFKGNPDWQDAFESVGNAPMQKGKRPQQEVQDCCICLSDERNVAFIPCGHAVCCKGCAAKVKHCPICRKTIKNKINLFYS